MRGEEEIAPHAPIRDAAPPGAPGAVTSSGRPVPGAWGGPLRLPAAVVTRVGPLQPGSPRTVRPMPPRMLEQRLARLADPSIATLPLESLLQTGLPHDRRPFLLSFDGGYPEHVEIVLPLLERLGLRASFFVPELRVGRRGEGLGAPEIRALQRRGMGIGLGLPPATTLATLRGAAFRRTLEPRLRQLEDVTGRAIRTAACLGARPAPAVCERLRSLGLEALCFAEPGHHWRIGGLLCIARLPLSPSTPPGRWNALVRMDALADRSRGFTLPDDRPPRATVGP
ncbi:MAG: polysaccharide deacetylase family protein [Planctomycetota bacterium]|nr:MAG: polysaccharide deacetylase family protein [Planctomycetota bacterium]